MIGEIVEESDKTVTIQLIARVGKDGVYVGGLEDGSAAAQIAPLLSLLIEEIRPGWLEPSDAQ